MCLNTTNALELFVDCCGKSVRQHDSKSLILVLSQNTSLKTQARGKGTRVLRTLEVLVLLNVPMLCGIHRARICLDILMGAEDHFLCGLVKVVD